MERRDSCGREVVWQKNHRVTILNSPGTIDEGYRGEISVLLINHGKEPFTVERGIRVAQLVVQQRVHVELVEAHVVSKTERGKAGFGSTGD